MTRRLLIAMLALGLVAAGCGGDDDDGGGVATGNDQDDEAPADEADLALADSAFGDILVDADGRTLYLFMPDAQGKSTCYNQCATTWPAAAAITTVGDGLDEDLLGTTTRDGGQVQATYNGWPLYRFANDRAEGDTNGQGINSIWYVVDADGEPVKQAAGGGTPPIGY